MRSRSEMSGSTFNAFNTINLANESNTDVIYPNNDKGYDALNTSLWTFNETNSQNVYANTVNMQVIDTINNDGTYYYAIRVATNASNVIESNIKLFAIEIK